MKKYLILFITALFFAFPVCAEENAIVAIDGKLLSSEKIIYNESGEELVKNGDFYMKKPVGTKSDSVNPLVSLGKKYKNEIFNLDMEFDFTNAEGEETSFDGFQLRSAATDKKCWTTDCYVIIVREKSVEIQSFAQGENTFLLNRKCEIPKSKKVNVTLGAVDTEKGVYIFIKIDGELYGTIDKNSRIKEAGYFNFEWRSGLKIYSESTDAAFIPMTDLTYSPVESKVISEISEITADKTPENVSCKWYISNEGYTHKTKDIIDLSEGFTLIDGEAGEDLLLMDSDIGKYVYCEMNIDGVRVNSEIEYVASLKYILSRGFAAAIGYRGAIAEGKAFLLDRDSEKIYADINGNYSYLPVRAIAEAYGMPVFWDEKTQTVSLKAVSTADLPTDTSFVIGKQGFVRLRGLMGSSMPGVPYIKEGRTFIDISAMQQILDYKNMIYDENSGLIVFTAAKIKLTEAEINELINIITEIKQEDNK